MLVRATSGDALASATSECACKRHVLPVVINFWMDAVGHLLVPIMSIAANTTPSFASPNASSARAQLLAVRSASYRTMGATSPIHCLDPVTPRRRTCALVSFKASGYVSFSAFAYATESRAFAAFSVSNINWRGMSPVFVLNAARNFSNVAAVGIMARFNRNNDSRPRMAPVRDSTVGSFSPLTNICSAPAMVGNTRPTVANNSPRTAPLLSVCSNWA